MGCPLYFDMHTDVVHGRSYAELAEHSQHGPQREPVADGGAVSKAPQEAVRVVLMPDGGYAVAVEVRRLSSQPGPSP